MWFRTNRVLFYIQLAYCTVILVVSSSCYLERTAARRNVSQGDRMEEIFQSDGSAEKPNRDGRHCMVCGSEFHMETVKCPDCGRLCCTEEDCIVEHYNEKLVIHQMLCKFCYHKRMLLEEEERRNRIIWYAEIVFVVLVTIALLVMQWF